MHVFSYASPHACVFTCLFPCFNRMFTNEEKGRLYKLHVLCCSSSSKKSKCKVYGTTCLIVQRLNNHRNHVHGVVGAYYPKLPVGTKVLDEKAEVQELLDEKTSRMVTTLPKNLEALTLGKGTKHNAKQDLQRDCCFSKGRCGIANERGDSTCRDLSKWMWGQECPDWGLDWGPCLSCSV